MNPSHEKGPSGKINDEIVKNALAEMKDAVASMKKPKLKIKEDELLYQVIKEVHQKGVVGEEETIMVLICKIMLRLVKNAKSTSSNLVVSDSSGAGKDYITKKICEVLLPKRYSHHFTDISEKALDYWKPLKPMAEWDVDDKKNKIPTYDSLDGHVIHFEDPSPEALAGSTFKTMASGGNESIKVANHKSQHIKIDGKPVILVTSLNTVVDLEGIRRWDAVRVDTSNRQTKAIVNQALLDRTDIKNKSEKTELMKYLQTLESKNVILPECFSILGQHLPNTLLSRTVVYTIMDFISASAVLHQKFRNHRRFKIREDKEEVDHDTIIANGFDYDFGIFIFNKIHESSGVALNKDEEQLVNVLDTAGYPLKLSEIAPLITHTKQWLYNNLDNFKRKGIIEEVLEYDESCNKEVQKLKTTEKVKVKKIPSANMVLKGFKGVLKNEYKVSFNGFNGFKKTIHKINNDREKLGLKKVSYVDSLENLENQEKLPVEGVLKPVENPLKTPPLDEKVKNAIDFIKKIPEDNYEGVVDILGETGTEKLINDGTFIETSLGRTLQLGKV